ncbi:VWA domain-containing protein [Candidatus Latescibacterota bacterium]
MFRFASPLWLLALVVPVYVLVRFFLKRGRTDAALVFPDTSIFQSVGSGFGSAKRMVSLLFAIATVTVLVLGMARPQSGRSFHTRTTYGIDIILTMDISSSMAAMDFDPLTRFEAAKEVVKDFIRNRTSDRIGLVVFSAQSFTLCPLTLDYRMLDEFVDMAWDSRIDDGTAIGSAIATSINRLRDSEVESKIVILLTDGMNNRGNMDPVTAARLAGTYSIKIYTIGVGTEGQAPMMLHGRQVWTETHIDEDTLRQVAAITGGKYYRATNRNELEQIYDEINQLETTKIDYREWVEYNELYQGFLTAGFFLSILCFLCDRTILRRIP